MIRCAVTALALVSLASCGLTEETWPDEYAAAWCKRSRSCDRSAFDEAWAGTADCRQTLAEWTEDGILGLEEDFPGCDFDLEEGRDCLVAVRDATCEAFLAGDFGDECNTHLVVCDD